ncbi:MAG TPA: mitochondrial fission ELM1 family protein [Rhodospirillales bacterium]|nr:mitochondrial fission ELM1 family protein [Rhodospirillales bacterium]
MRRAPRVWATLGHKAGDNSQVRALAEALGLPFEERHFVYRPYELATNLLLGPTLAGVITERSSALAPPWPDLIISAGRRNEPICRWIQTQAAPQRVRLVHVGRPWAKIERFDLIVTTPQYRLPILPNVLHNKTPLHRITFDRLRHDGEAWEPRLKSLPKPHIAVMIGGNSGPFSFDRAAAERFAKQASEMANARGGSLLVSTSARTQPPAIDAFLQAVSAPAHVYRWTAGDPDNPYFAFLGLAEEIIVTGDSMSMLAEACATHKRVYIFDLGEGRYAMRESVAEAARAEKPTQPWWQRLEKALWDAFWYRQMMRFGPQRLSRDIRIVHRHLVESGLAVWLGDEFPAGQPLPSLDCVPRAVARVRALLEDGAFSAEGEDDAFAWRKSA